ncbi:biotin transporter BioY [Candidatus Bathyarchaeota archaeon]|nr:MAG: biotin transporter BioY [Candidatus Bathyarchaeota archaeon]
MDKKRKRRRSQLTILLPKYVQTSESTLRLNLKQKVLLSLLFAGLTGLGAQVRIPLPFTPVPITLQVFFVLLSGIFLGSWFGSFSQGLYVTLGAAGIPWFAGLRGGYLVLTGITGGYLVGFIFAAFLIGWFTERFSGVKRFSTRFLVMLLGIVIIYVCGALWFSFIFRTSFLTTLMLTVLPFIPGDIIKAASAAALGNVSILKKFLLVKPNKNKFFKVKGTF